MKASVRVAGEHAYNPATGEIFTVKNGHNVVVWEYEGVFGVSRPILAISVPFTNLDAAENAIIRLNKEISEFNEEL